MKVAAINEVTRQVEFKDVPAGFTRCYLNGDYYPRKEMKRAYGLCKGEFISASAQALSPEEQAALREETAKIKRSGKFYRLSKRAKWINELNDSAITVKELKAMLEGLDDNARVVIQADKGCFGDEREYDFGTFDGEPIDDAEIKDVYVLGKA